MRLRKRALVLVLPVTFSLACATRQPSLVQSVSYEDRISPGLCLRIRHIGGAKVEYSLTAESVSTAKEVEARRSIRCAKEAIRSDNPCRIGGKEHICSTCTCQEDANASIVQQDGLVIITCGDLVYTSKN